jgi:hypothetical protein
MEQDSLVQKEEKRRNYMRDYMRKYKKTKYDENPDVIKVNNRTRYLKLKGAVELDEEDVKKFGIYLADIIKLRALLQTIPSNLIKDVINQGQTV